MTTVPESVNSEAVLQQCVPSPPTLHTQTVSFHRLQQQLTATFHLQLQFQLTATSLQ